MTLDEDKIMEMIAESVASKIYHSLGLNGRKEIYKITAWNIKEALLKEIELDADIKAKLEKKISKLVELA